VTTSAAPVNQCVGALTTGTVRACTPDPATADASVDGVTQCNGSVNGGGGSMTCSVSPSTTSNSAFDFLANQCNGSANGGGGLVECETDISTVVLASDTTSVETGGETSAGGTGGRTLPNTGADAGVALGIAALLLMSGVAALAVSRRRSVRAAR
jgi:LPXTG-motif cell wall-anchored protein